MVCDDVGDWRRYLKGRKIESVSMILTDQQKSLIGKAAGIDSVRADISGNEPEDWVEPKDKQFKWTPDNFGPLVIPHKGLQIVLNHRNFLLYRRTIEELESGKPEEKKGHYYLDGKKTDTYTFGEITIYDGDNRADSNDSRTGDLYRKRNYRIALLIVFPALYRLQVEPVAEDNSIGFMQRLYDYGLIQIYFCNFLI